MIDYLLKSASCLALLLLFYHLVLEKEKMHIFNRFYLLGSVIFSLLVPFATLTVASATAFTEAVKPILYTTASIENTAPISIKESFDYSLVFIGIYGLVSSILLLRFGKNVFTIIQKIKANKKIQHQSATLVLVEDKILPHSFWNSIFINKNEFEQGTIETELFTHELTHVSQKHTLDIVFIEMLHILFWINPLFIFLKKAIQLNHEFLADETVINQHQNTFHYQHLLLNKAAWNNEYYLASNLNYSLTKKRLKMMTTQSSRTKVLLKKLAVIPLFTGFVFLFAERVEAQENIKFIDEVPLIKTRLETEIYKEYVYKNGFIRVEDHNGKKINKKYSELTTEEKKKVPPPPPSKTKRKVPTQKLIEDLKDTSKYAIWINEKVVKNSILDKYKNTDFSNYSVSFVNNNARSKRFPQEYQVHLSTNKYFYDENNKKNQNFLKYIDKNHKNDLIIIEEEVKEQLTKEDVNSPIPKNSSSKQSIRNTQVKLEVSNQSLKKENSTVGIYIRKNKEYEQVRIQAPHFIKSDQERQTALMDNFLILRSMYANLSKEQKRKTKKPTHPHDPYVRLMKNNIVFYKLRTELTEEDKLLFPPPPARWDASKEEKLRVKKAREDWQKRTGNDIPVPPLPTKNKKSK